MIARAGSGSGSGSSQQCHRGVSSCPANHRRSGSPQQSQRYRAGNGSVQMSRGTLVGAWLCALIKGDVSAAGVPSELIKTGFEDTIGPPIAGCGLDGSSPSVLLPALYMPARLKDGSKMQPNQRRKFRTSGYKGSGSG